MKNIYLSIFKPPVSPDHCFRVGGGALFALFARS